MSPHTVPPPTHTSTPPPSSPTLSHAGEGGQNGNRGTISLGSAILIPDVEIKAGQPGSQASHRPIKTPTFPERSPTDANHDFLNGAQLNSTSPPLNSSHRVFAALAAHFLCQTMPRLHALQEAETSRPDQLLFSHPYHMSCSMTTHLEPPPPPPPHSALSFPNSTSASVNQHVQVSWPATITQYENHQFQGTRARVPIPDPGAYSRPAPRAKSPDTDGRPARRRRVVYRGPVQGKGRGNLAFIIRPTTGVEHVLQSPLDCLGTL